MRLRLFLDAAFDFVNKPKILPHLQVTHSCGANGSPVLREQQVPVPQRPPPPGSPELWGSWTAEQPSYPALPPWLLRYVLVGSCCWKVAANSLICIIIAWPEPLSLVLRPMQISVLCGQQSESTRLQALWGPLWALPALGLCLSPGS